MEPGADLVGPLPDELQQLIVYTAAIGSAAKKPDAARALLKHLTTPEARSCSSQTARSARLALLLHSQEIRCVFVP
jgi:hypothetical protein